MSSAEGETGANTAAPGRPDWVALIGAAVTVALHLVLQARRPNIFFIGGACLFWAGFVAVRARRDRGAFRRWGFRTDNLAAASVAPAALFVLIAAGCGVYAHFRGTLYVPPHLPAMLLLYPVWGVIQQFLSLGVVVGNLELIPALGRRRAVLTLLGAALFAVVHVNNLRVVPATFLLELAVLPLYFRYRNLWPLGVLHGWAGALFYLWVLDRDLWVENFH